MPAQNYETGLECLVAKYNKPDKTVHRGFYYLDDETVINSLSTVEAGKVDEVVSKVNSAREGGFGGGVGLYGAKVEAGKKTSSEFEESIVRTRTRFSIFELWYENLRNSKALGTFEGWDKDILADVRPGDTVQLKARLDLVPIQTVFRLFLWYVQMAKTPGTIFSVKGEALKSLKEQEQLLHMLIGDAEKLETVAIAKPIGDEGPPVVLQMADRWMIGDLGHLSGEYVVVGQVEHVLEVGQELPALRIIRTAPATPREVTMLKEMVPNFIDPAKAFGLDVSESDAGIKGPALWLNPIAVFR
jgi:hypothetical protein